MSINKYTGILQKDETYLISQLVIQKKHTFLFLFKLSIAQRRYCSFLETTAGI